MDILITGTEDINIARLLTLRSALKLQMLGMKCRGRQASVIIKEELNIPKSKSLKQTLNLLETALEQKGHKVSNPS